MLWAMAAVEILKEETGLTLPQTSCFESVPWILKALLMTVSRTSTTQDIPRKTRFPYTQDTFSCVVNLEDWQDHQIKIKGKKA